MRRINKITARSFPEALIGARKAARWNQGELAARLGIGQQTVSKWERGLVLPARDVAAKLLRLFAEESAVELREVLKRQAKPGKAVAARGIAALTTKLNLDHLTSEQFQSFAADLFQALHPDAPVSIYGVSGDVQEGLDIEIRFREGYRYTAQCKRVKNFGPQKVVEAVRAHPGRAKKKFLLITRPATQQTRDAAKKYAKHGWELWDIEDMSRRVRYLPGDKARVLVDAYAPGQRREFLGIEQPSPFSSPNVFFRELLRPQAIFSHVWAIVGRTAELEELRGAAEYGAAFITIVGAGGSGKSRLALEFLNRLGKAQPDRVLRVLTQGAAVVPVDIERYRNERATFLIEDAHDRDDLEGLVPQFRRLAPDSTLVFTTRPYGLEGLESLLARQGLDDRSRIVRLHDLTRDQLEALSREVLTARRFRTDLAEDIARLADRSPLFAVIASNLVAEKRMHPRVLSNEETFKRQVLAHFGDVLRQSLARTSGEQLKVRDTLNLVAVLQPVDLNSSEFAAALEALYKHPASDYDGVKRLLADASVLVARGGRSRIVPDMLGDYVLEQACAAPGRATFPERVLAAQQPGQLRNVLHNLAKLDWRLTVKDGLTSRASTQIWRAVERLYRDNKDARHGILEAVESAAYFLPGQALDFLDNVDASPSGAGVDRVCRIIRNVAYHREYVRDSVERLWELGKDMPGQLNSLLDHPIRQLQAIASIEPGKPIEYNQDVLEFGLELLRQPDAGAHTWSPLEFLEQILATEGHTHTAKGNAIQIGSFTVNIKTLAPLRKQLIDAIFDLAEHSDLRIALRAIRTVGNAALQYPIGSFGNAPAKEARPALNEEFLGTIQRFEMLVRRGTLDPLVVMEIVRAVSWHAAYAQGPTQDAARAVLQAVPPSFAQDLTECLVEGWGHHRERATGNATSRIEAWRHHQQETARALRNQAGTVKTALDVLRERLNLFAAADQAFRGQPHIFVRLLCEEWPDAARAIAEAGLTDLADPLAQFTEQGLGAILDAGSPDANTIAKALLDTGSVDLKRRVAFAYGRLGGRVQGENLAMLERLCADEDEITVQYAIGVLHRLATENPPLAKALFFKVNIGASTKIADELASHFCNSEQLNESFTTEETERLLQTLLALEQIEEHWVQEMLGILSGPYPQAVLGLLLGRITQAEKDPRGYSYKAIPFHWDQKTRFKFRENGYLREAMARILAFAREAHEREWKERHAVNELFAATVGSFDRDVRDYLSEYLTTADTYGVRALSQVLSEISGDFVFSEIEFVEHVLRHAGRFGRKRQEEAQFALYRTATYGMRSGTRGKPFPQDVAMKQSAEGALARIRQGSPARKLFTWIRDHAQEQIQRAYSEAEPLEEDD